jgi:hypothetical protein
MAPDHSYLHFPVRLAGSARMGLFFRPYPHFNHIAADDWRKPAKGR